MDENGETPDNGLVVVGVDDSPGARAALVFAFRDAARRDATLRVVATYVPPDYTQVWLATSRGADLSGDDGSRAEVQAGVEQMVTGVRAELVGESAPRRVEAVAAAGSPAAALIELSREADLLVVGSRGRGGFTSMALGSVGLHCVLHAHCPVTVVRPVAPARRDEHEFTIGEQALRAPLT